LGDALNDGGSDGDLKILHSPGQEVNPHLLANFVPELMLPKDALQEGFKGKG
jgi:hypothetical protein